MLPFNHLEDNDVYAVAISDVSVMEFHVQSSSLIDHYEGGHTSHLVDQ